MSIKNQTKQYANDEAQLQALTAERAEAKAKLKALEADLESDLDTVANGIVEAKRVIDLNTAKIDSLSKRLLNLRSEIVLSIKDAESDFKEVENTTQRQRRAVADEILTSDDWQLYKKQTLAVNALRGFFWKTLKAEIAPHEPSIKDSRDAAIELGLWIDDPEQPPEIQEAINAISYDKYND